MLGDFILAIVMVITIELALSNVRARRIREARAQAYLDGIHAANRVHREIGAAIPQTDSRH